MQKDHIILFIRYWNARVDLSKINCLTFHIAKHYEKTAQKLSIE